MTHLVKTDKAHFPDTLDMSKAKKVTRSIDPESLKKNNWGIVNLATWLAM